MGIHRLATGLTASLTCFGSGRQGAADEPKCNSKGTYLTEEALTEIRRAAPELNPAKLVKGLRKADLPTLLTVAFFVRLIQRKLAGGEEGGTGA